MTFSMNLWQHVGVPWRWVILMGGMALVLLSLQYVLHTPLFDPLLFCLLIAYSMVHVIHSLRVPDPQMRRRQLINRNISLALVLMAASRPFWLFLLTPIPGVLTILMILAMTINGVLQLTQVRFRDTAGKVQLRWDMLAMAVFPLGIGGVLMVALLSALR